MRVLTGIQPSGALHIGNYFGAIKQMIDLQEKSDLFIFIANYHALTSLKDGEALKNNTLDAAINFLSLGIDHTKVTFWTQSDVKEVLELYWVLSGYTPMGLLERAHSYKDKVAKGIAANHSLFSYPVLMAADILLYDSEVIPVGKDQIQHVEITRDIAIKFNNDFGDIFKIPEFKVDENVATVPGLDGAKMSKSYGNTIAIREDADSITKKIRTMPTDPARVRKTDPGDPEKCPVWPFHQIYSDDATCAWVQDGCKNAKIGCIECKQPVIEAVLREQQPLLERAQVYLDDPTLVRNIIADGSEKARKMAQETMRDVREVMGLG